MCFSAIFFIVCSVFSCFFLFSTAFDPNVIIMPSVAATKLHDIVRSHGRNAALNRPGLLLLSLFFPLLSIAVIFVAGAGCHSCAAEASPLALAQFMKPSSTLFSMAMGSAVMQSAAFCCAL